MTIIERMVNYVHFFHSMCSDWAANMCLLATLAPVRKKTYSLLAEILLFFFFVSDYENTCFFGISCRNAVFSRYFSLNKFYAWSIGFLVQRTVSPLPAPAPSRNLMNELYLNIVRLNNCLKHKKVHINYHSGRHVRHIYVAARDLFTLIKSTKSVWTDKIVLVLHTHSFFQCFLCFSSSPVGGGDCRNRV